MDNGGFDGWFSAAPFVVLRGSVLCGGGRGRWGGGLGHGEVGRRVFCFVLRATIVGSGDVEMMMKCMFVPVSVPMFVSTQVKTGEDLAGVELQNVCCQKKR